MAKLSVNVNKIATLRNARGGNLPNLIKFTQDCEEFGAEGITIHPRPDERHITKNDVYDLKKIIGTEFNIEGYPNKRFMNLVLEVKPQQVTLVPDPPNALTSNAGWNTLSNKTFLTEICSELSKNQIRTSIFVGTDLKNIEGAKTVETDRIEFYTGPYAEKFNSSPSLAIKSYVEAAKLCDELKLGINAGHDLNLNNLKFFKQNIPNLLEVSIGHALWVDAIYFGMENTIQMYKKRLI